MLLLRLNKVRRRRGGREAIVAGVRAAIADIMGYAFLFLMRGRGCVISGDSGDGSSNG